VVEKADAGRDFGHAGAVEHDAALDLGLLGLTLDRRDPHASSPAGGCRPARRRLLTRTPVLTRTVGPRHSTGIIARNHEHPVHPAAAGGESRDNPCGHLT